MSPDLPRGNAPRRTPLKRAWRCVSASPPHPAAPADKDLSKRQARLWKAFDRIPELSNASDLPFFAQFAYSQPFVGKLAAAGGRIVAGTDTPTQGLVPGFSLHRELELLVQ